MGCVITSEPTSNRSTARNCGLSSRRGLFLKTMTSRGWPTSWSTWVSTAPKNFPHEDLVKFLQSTGMRFGADVNARTGFDETTYMLTIPTDKPELVEKSFQVLEDWAHNITFDPEEVEKERGVIMEEWRLRRGAGARINDKLFPLLLEGSRYADRLPIGKTEVIQNFKHERLKQFYTDWYRPDLMAVVAVGDFDKAAIEGMIKARFGPIPAAPKTARERKAYDIPDHPGALFAILADKEMTTTSVEIDNLLPASEEGTVKAYRESLVNRLFSDHDVRPVFRNRSKAGSAVRRRIGVP